MIVPILRQKGMTLIEVMVALFIFAVTGTAIMKAATEHLNSVGQIESVMFATWVANNRLNQVMLEDTWPPKNNAKGNISMADRTWYWQQSVTATNDKDLRAVAITVGLDERLEGSLTTVTTFIAKPTQGEAP